LDGLWYRHSIRGQLLLVFVLIDVLAVLVAGSVMVVRARMQTRVEMASSMRLAELLVGDAVHLVHQELPAEQYLQALPAQLQSMRHVRFAVSDAAGHPIAAEKPGTDHLSNETASAPSWFVRLVAPAEEVRYVSVIAAGRDVGRVEIVGEPGDEIAEVWNNAVAIGAVALFLNIAMIGSLYVLFGRVLDPLNVLANGLSDLERQTYSVRLPLPRTRELSAISDHFNALALALETVHAENLLLNRRLITAQDDERRRTALELHDEVGPCLFGLKANASSIASVAQGLPDKARKNIAERLHDVLSIIAHLQTINRSMLDRLRPMALGHVPLEEMLGQLVRERAREQPQIEFSLAAGDLERSYGDSIDLTIYRCAQESLTNAVRHAQPKRVSVAVDNMVAEARLVLTVSDDGCGMDAAAAPGFGTRGMRERVEGLGGRFAVESEPGRGTCVRIAIPLADARDTAAGAMQSGDSIA
jgi:two-component system, NarL family, sensor histidine kinase UhpB